MPLYLFHCRSCGHEFEELVFGAEQPSCERCAKGPLERAVPRVSVRGSSARANERPSSEPSGFGGPCGSCGDPRGEGACGLEG